MDRGRVEPGQESVWDYPRPPRVERSERRVEIVADGLTVVDTVRALRVLETSHPPVYYVPVADVRTAALVGAPGTSVCEWKGTARYHDLLVGTRRIARAAWDYPLPAPGFEVLTDHVAFYPHRVDECRLDGVPVRPQPGGFYGGWITPDVVGPFKGEPGTGGW